MINKFMVRGFFLFTYSATSGMLGVATKDQSQSGLLQMLGMKQNAKYFITLDTNPTNISARIPISPEGFTACAMFVNELRSIKEGRSSGKTFDPSLAVFIWDQKKIRGGGTFSVTQDDLRAFAQFSDLQTTDSRTIFLRGLSGEVLCRLMALANYVELNNEYTNHFRPVFFEKLKALTNDDFSNFLRGKGFLWEIVSTCTLWSSFVSKNDLLMWAWAQPLMNYQLGKGNKVTAIGTRYIAISRAYGGKDETHIVDVASGKMVVTIPGEFISTIGSNYFIVNVGKGEKSETNIIDVLTGKTVNIIPGKFEKNTDNGLIDFDIDKSYVAVNVLGNGGREAHIIDILTGKTVKVVPGEFNGIINAQRIAVDVEKRGNAVDIRDVSTDKIVRKIYGEFVSDIGVDHIAVEMVAGGKIETHIVNILTGSTVKVISGQFLSAVDTKHFTVGVYSKKEEKIHFEVHVIDISTGRTLNVVSGFSRVAIDENHIVASRIDEKNKDETLIINTLTGQVDRVISGWFRSAIGKTHIVVGIKIEGKDEIHIVDVATGKIVRRICGWFMSPIGANRVAVNVEVEGKDETHIVDASTGNTIKIIPGRFASLVDDGLIVIDNNLYPVITNNFEQILFLIAMWQYKPDKPQKGVAAMLKRLIYSPRSFSTLFTTTTFLDAFVSLHHSLIKHLVVICGPELVQAAVEQLIKNMYSSIVENKRLDEGEKNKEAVFRLTTFLGQQEREKYNAQASKLLAGYQEPWQ